MSGSIALRFLTLALEVGEWLASRPSHFIAGERTTDTHLIGGCVGPRDSLDGCKEDKKFLHCREWNPRCPPRNPSPYRLSYPDSFVLVYRVYPMTINNPQIYEVQKKDAV
jgi:hypothetical protein